MKRSEFAMRRWRLKRLTAELEKKQHLQPQADSQPLSVSSAPQVEAQAQQEKYAQLQAMLQEETEWTERIVRHLSSAPAADSSSPSPSAATPAPATQADLFPNPGQVLQWLAVFDSKGRVHKSFRKRELSVDEKTHPLILADPVSTIKTYKYRSHNEYIKESRASNNFFVTCQTGELADDLSEQDYDIKQVLVCFSPD